MARDVLHAWLCGDYIGRFERNSDADRPRFIYSDSASRSLSLSLPRDIEPNSLLPNTHLDGLLPESNEARTQLMASTGARSLSPWDLLSAIGGDLQGGLVLHEDEHEPSLERPFSQIAWTDVVASRIRSIKNGATGFESSLGIAKPRFSLAGAQSKFALAIDSDAQMFWSDSATPSTHILKPEGSSHSGIELLEVAALNLARAAGVDAPRASQMRFDSETVFAIERFDRQVNPDTGIVSRLHVEDLTQALGRPVSAKYEVHIDDICDLLRTHTGDDELGYQFIRQYAFNVIIGNSDAHGKNYSIFLDPDESIRLAPLYDAIPIGMFPEYGQDLAMPVGWEEMHYRVSHSDWIEASTLAGLDSDRVHGIVKEVADGVLEYLDATIGSVDHRRVTAARVDQIRANAERQSGPAPEVP